jgi:diguanylate cyclase (GGDEF)-like protein
MMAHIQAATGSHPREVPDVTVSVGVASFPENASITEALVKAADDAMYVSKRSEKNKVSVSETAPSLVPAKAAG